MTSKGHHGNPSRTLIVTDQQEMSARIAEGALNMAISCQARIPLGSTRPSAAPDINAVKDEEDVRWIYFFISTDRF